MAEKGLKDCGEKLRRDSDAWGRDYTICEVTELMGESPGTVYGLMRAGIIPYEIVKGQHRIPQESFLKWWDAFRKDMDECHR